MYLEQSPGFHDADELVFRETVEDACSALMGINVRAPKIMVCIPFPGSMLKVNGFDPPAGLFAAQWFLYIGLMRMQSPKHRVTSPKRWKQRTVEEYLAAVPEPARSTLNSVRAAIRSAVPAEATETISYGMPAFCHKGVLVWYAAFADHCSLFPKASVIEMFKEELQGLATSKGTIQFPLDRPLPKALVRKLVKARIAENEDKKRR